MKILTLDPPKPTSTAYTWGQTWRFFLLGLIRACLLTLAPVGISLWNWVHNWGKTPIEWTEIFQLAVACAGPTAALYWHNHWHQLKAPPSLDVPDEFLMTQQTEKTTVVEDNTTTESKTVVTTVSQSPKPIEPKGE